MMTAPHWSDPYVGLAYREADCGELCVRVQREVFGRTVVIPTERSHGSEALSEQLEAVVRSMLEDQLTVTPAPVEGDVVQMRARGSLRHVGLLCVIGGEHHVLHALRGARQTVRHRVRDLPRHNVAVVEYLTWLC